MKASCPVRKRIIKEATILIGRRLSGPGKILVKKGDLVTPEALVAIGQVSAGFRSINVAKELGVSVGAIPKILKKTVGEKIYEGEIIAENPKLFGVFKKKIISPFEGVIKEYDSQSGNLTIEFQSKLEKIVCGVWGVIDSVDDASVSIKTKITQIYGIVGSGGLRHGVLSVITGNEDFLLEGNIGVNNQSQVLVGGAFISANTLSKALTLRVAGIITGGMHVSDFWSAGGRPPGQISSDIGITIAIIEGFGRIPIDEKIYLVLKENNGRFALIDGDKASVVIPHKTDPDPKVLNQELSGMRDLEIGDRVRITSGFRFGTIGKVVNISQGQIETGLLQIIADVWTNTAKYQIPVSNLEIID